MNSNLPYWQTHAFADTFEDEEIRNSIHAWVSQLEESNRKKEEEEFNKLKNAIKQALVEIKAKELEGLKDEMV